MPLPTGQVRVRFISKIALSNNMREKIIAIDAPLSEITMRKYEKPYNLNQRELVRKLCLSTGLLQPGDSRDIIVDVMHVLLKEKKTNRELSSEEIRNFVIQSRKDANLALAGIASSNIRRQLKRLRDIFFIQKVRNKYRINEFSNLHDIFEEKIEQYLLNSVVLRVKEYIKAVDAEF